MRYLKIAFLALLFLAAKQIVVAQDYRTALGLRVGSSTGVTVKHFLHPGAALEGLLTTRWDGFLITGLYEFTGNAFDEPNLGWYLGGGAHIGFWSERHRSRRNGNSVFGIDFIAGLEYTFIDFPLNLALDWKPAIDLVGYHGFWGNEFALSIRFAIQ
jgi:hypothetical protein